MQCSNRSPHEKMKLMYASRSVNIIVAALVSVSMIAFSWGPSNAATLIEAENGSRSKQATPEATPDNLPAKSLDSIRVEARLRGLSQGETQLAVETQRIINEYKSLPDSEKDAVKSEAELQRAIEKTAVAGERTRGPSRSPVSTQNKATDAVDCVLAIADVASIAIPGGNVWKVIKLLGGVTDRKSVV